MNTRPQVLTSKWYVWLTPAWMGTNRIREMISRPRFSIGVSEPRSDLSEETRESPPPFRDLVEFPP